jgi:type IV pilus assembly protein PilO
VKAILAAWRGASTVEQLGFVGLGLVALSVGCYLVILSPAHARRVALDTRLAALQRELGQAHSQVSDLARHRREKVEFEKRLGVMAERLSPNRDISPLYQTLQEAAAQTGLALALFRPREPRAESYYTEIPIAVTAQGTYHRLEQFLARVATLSRLVTIEEIKISAVDRPQVTLRAELILTAYVYRPIGTSHPARAVSAAAASGTQAAASGTQAAASGTQRRGGGLHAP